MSEYDFHQLSDKEFEVLCCDLLGPVFSNRFERFKSGRDGGVDGRFFAGAGEVILQCKHWVETPLLQLVRHLSDSEAVKVERLKPARYLVATSHKLSRNDKKKICEIFSPYMLSESDVFGQGDLNDLIAQNPEVERRHYKLWMASSRVLSAILNAPIHGRSDFLIEDIVADSVRYVVTDNHREAIAKLEAKGVIIITGEAGIGKTTLARSVLMHYLAEGYEMFSVGDDISEAEGVFQKDGKQIFYFDDFLGSNYLDAISGNSGAQVVNFMRRVKADSKKRFVLTSRTTILNQGKILISALSSGNTSRDEFEVSLQSLSRLDRAKILYNHMWHSGLSDPYKDKIYEGRRYRGIVDHPNYNPRIIAYLTDIQRLDDVPADRYWAHILALLKNPAEVWRHPFDAQHDDYGRSLVLLVAMNGRAIAQGDLTDAYFRYIAMPHFSSVRGQSDFDFNLRHLCGSMLNRVLQDGAQSITLFNPSIRDFVISRYAANRVVLKAIFVALQSEESVSALRGIHSSGHVDDAFVYEVLTTVVRGADDSDYVGYFPGYVSRAYLFLSKIASEDVLRDQFPVGRAATFVEREDLPELFEPVLDFLLLAHRLGAHAVRSVGKLVEQGCQNRPSDTELERLGSLMALQDCSDELRVMFRSSVSELFIELAYEQFPAYEVFDGLVWDESYEEARDRLNDLVVARLEVFGFSNDFDLVDEIVSAYDFEDQAQGYFMGRDNDSNEGSYRSIFVGDDIDDLFDRS